MINTYKDSYFSLEKYYIYPQYIDKYGFKKQLQDLDDIVATNPNDFSTLLPKKYYYFRMQLCGHPEKISLSELKRRIENNLNEKLCCKVCKLFIGSQTNYETLGSLYSVNNLKPLSKIKLRKDSIIFKCPDCGEETSYSEFRWVLEGLKNGKPFKDFCRRKCFSIGGKYPKIIHLWDVDKNGADIFKVSANDENLYHRKWYFKCAICKKTTNTPTTAYNVIKNSSKCVKHKSNPMSSFAEQSILLSFKRCLSVFSYIEINNKLKYSRNSEFDIFIKVTINNANRFFAIEYDGPQHIKRVKEDIEKNEYADSNNIYLIRVRDKKLMNIKLNKIGKIIQRTSSKKEELNEIIIELLKTFFKWFKSLGVEKKELSKVKSYIESEIKTVNIIRDENLIFQQLSNLPKKLLKDDPNLITIFNQLRQDVRDKLGDYITVTEQDVKRPFACHKCSHHWEQFVNVVVRNYQNSKGNAIGCPACANKNEKQINELKSIAFFLKNNGFTQKTIGEKLGRSQSTISNWLSNEGNTNQ